MRQKYRNFDRVSLDDFEKVINKFKSSELTVVKMGNRYSDILKIFITNSYDMHNDESNYEKLFIVYKSLKDANSEVEVYINPKYKHLLTDTENITIVIIKEELLCNLMSK